MKKVIGVGLILLVFLGIFFGLGLIKNKTGLGVPSCGKNYNTALDLALQNKDITFCWSNPHLPVTTTFNNGIIINNICKNSKKEVIIIDNENCIQTFATYYNQPQLCTIFDNEMYEAMSINDKDIVNHYLKNEELPTLSGFLMNCVYEFNRIKNVSEGCNYMDDSVVELKNAYGDVTTYRDKEICIDHFRFE